MNELKEMVELTELQLSGNLLGNVAARMREDLGALSLLDGKLFPAAKRKRSAQLDKVAAYAYQTRTRMLRLAQNLETMGALLRNPDFERESCNVVQLLSDFCEGAADLVEMTGIRLTFSCMESAHHCAIQPDYLRQCFGHFVSNAMKNASEDPSAEKHIRVGFEHPRSGGEIVLFAEDNGRGIAPENMPTLFEEGWRKSPETLLLRGAGMGLSICKRVAEGHGGTLRAESTPGKGSRLAMRIPDEKGLIKLRQPGFFEPNGDVNPIIIMLSDALPWEAFTIENLL